MSKRVIYNISNITLHSLDVSMGTRMDGWMDEGIHGPIEEWMHWWMCEWMDEYVDTWIDTWVHGCG